MGWKGWATLWAIWLLAGYPATAAACPFCSAVSQTLTERINTADLAALVELIESPPRASDASQAPVSNEAIEAAKSTFRVHQVYRGQPQVKAGDTLKALYLGKAPPGSKSLLTGLDLKAPQWALPVELTPRALEYLQHILQLPPRGTERLDFCEDYLEDAETLLQEDALNEFALADYPTIIQARGKYDHDRLVRWIQNPATPETRRRLYFTLLGTCGGEKDATMLESMIRKGVLLGQDAGRLQTAKNEAEVALKAATTEEAKSALNATCEKLDKSIEAAKLEEAAQLRGLDALLACYLTLGGPQRMPLVEELFLRNKDADYTQTYAAIMAVRFHGQEGNIIPRKRAVEALRLMLDRPQLADLVIPDLARWEDWESVDKLVELFKNSTKEWSYIRVPVINFLRACPKPEARAKLDELAKLDPESFKRAATFFPFGAGSPSTPQPAPKAEVEAKKQEGTPEKPAASGSRVPIGDDVQYRQPARLGATIALVVGTSDATGASQNVLGSDAKADEAADSEQASAGASTIGAVPASQLPAISRPALAVVVGGVPILAAAALFGLYWIILRLPNPKATDEA